MITTNKMHSLLFLKYCNQTIKMYKNYQIYMNKNDFILYKNIKNMYDLSVINIIFQHSDKLITMKY